VLKKRQAVLHNKTIAKDNSFHFFLLLQRSYYTENLLNPHYAIEFRDEA